MARWDRRYALVVALSLAVVIGLAAGLATEVGRPYPGFFFAIDYHVAPAEPAAAPTLLSRWASRRSTRGFRSCNVRKAASR